MNYTRVVEQLVAVIQELSLAKSLETIMSIVRKAARALTCADGATFVLRDEDRCFYADEDAIGPLWKGQRFPMTACISGWVMQNKTSCVIEDIYSDPRVPAEAYRPTFVKSLLMVPIRTRDPVGAIGNYWARHHKASEEEVRILQALADTTAVAMENVRMYADLEKRVHDRTCELERLNRLLVRENAERKRAEEEVRRQSITDPLTGLLNRRGFFQTAHHRLREACGTRREWAIVFLDVDGLKAVNDNLGHDAGDKLIIAAAEVIRDTFEGQIHARLGGDEFAALIEADDVNRVVDLLHHRVGGYMETRNPPFQLSLSAGVASFVPGEAMTLDDVINRADKAMYQDKRGKQRSMQPERGEGLKRLHA